MIDVAALTSGRNLPSSRYRIRQHIAPLAGLGVSVKEYCPAIDKWAGVPGKPHGLTNRQVLPVYALWQGVKLGARLPGLLKSHAADVTWLNKELLPGYPTLESWLGKPLIADIDDAIWLTPPFGNRVARKLAQHADVLIVGNEYLANWFERYNRNIHIVPTAIDTRLFQPRGSMERTESVFTIGWIGSQGNLAYLESIEDGLVEVCKRCVDARLLVVSDRRPGFRRLGVDKVVYRPWRESNEVADIQDMDVGLMPLPDSEWGRGKCAFKMLQYMAMEKPVVVSPVGMNARILEMGELGFRAQSEADWVNALVNLYEDRQQARRMGIVGRKVVQTNFDLAVIAEKLAAIFKSA
ncbi:glycosyltransferase family 4 protein [Thiolapillus sp.]